MSRYAEYTTVPIERSRGEIEKMLRSAGASHFAYMTEPSYATIVFQIKALRVRIVITMPDRQAPEFNETATGRRVRSDTLVEQRWEQECKRRWRAMNLVIKAKLIAVADNVSTLEREFYADIVLPNGKTIGQHLQPQLVALQTGAELKSMPMLPAPSDVIDVTRV